MPNPILDDIRKPFSFYGHGRPEASTANVKEDKGNGVLKSLSGAGSN